jgi:lysophospholipase
MAASTAPAPDGKLVAHARNPVPSGAKSGLFKGLDGKPLRYAHWDASKTPRLGTVCIVQGRGEFIEKWFETIADLRRRGFAVATYDCRGQGGSVRLARHWRRGHIKDFADHDKDLLRFMKDVVLPDCPPPFIALGHSTGGNILLRNACIEGSWFSKMVLSAPLIRFSPKALPKGRSQEMVGRWLALLSLLGMSEGYAARDGSDFSFETYPFEGNELSSDAERFERNKEVAKLAPHISVGSATRGWVLAATRSMRMINAASYAPRIKVPLLLIAAGADTVVDPRAIEDYGRRLKVGAYVQIPGSRHEILQERDEIRAQFWATFDAYVTGDRAEKGLVG